MQKITPFLWFNDQAEEAVNYYVSIFKDASIGKVSRYGEGMPAPAGTAMVVEFTLNGLNFLALNGGDYYKLNPAVSFVISVDTQEELDHYWDNLCDGGQPSRCGWLTDKFGLSWQVVPSILGNLMSDPDGEKAGRAGMAMMQMQKLNIAELQRAFDGE